MLRIAAIAACMAAIASAQLIGMSLCPTIRGVPDCDSDCVSWTATSGVCSVCKASEGPCSDDNPSVLATQVGSDVQINYYSDASCITPVKDWPGAQTVSMDGACHGIINVGQGDDYYIVSARITNVSAIIGGSVGACLFVLSCAIFLCCRYSKGRGCCCNNAAAPPVVLPIQEAIPIAYPVQLGAVDYPSPRFLQGGQPGFSSYPQVQVQAYAPSAPPPYCPPHMDKQAV